MPSKKYNVSVKAVMLVEGKFPLLKNERDEWELPGGNVDPGEQPEDCVVREVFEELNVQAQVDRLLDAWKYKIFPDQDLEVVIVTYACHTHASQKDFVYSFEHKELRFFSPEEIAGLNMPQGYKRAIVKFLKV